jgi:hypothetical protein
MQGQRTDIDQSNKAFLQRIKNKCILNENSCWIWQGTCNQRGRPMVSWKGMQGLVYRYTYLAKHGKPIKKGLYACHSCDEKLCCNPDHIFEGTNRDNQIDFMIKNEGIIHNGFNTYGDKYWDGRPKIELKLMIPSNLSDEERFKWYRDKYCHHDENGCWIWLREVGEDGYGRLKYRSKKHQSHRVMWMLANDKTPEDLEQLKKDNLVVGHVCPVEGAPNKACCNPDHLEIRTRSQNGLDTRSYSKQRKEELYTDEQLYEWLHIYEFVINELGENHKLLKSANGGKNYKLIADGLIDLGLVNENIRCQYLKDLLRGKSAKHIHNEFFDWTPLWK